MIHIVLLIVITLFSQSKSPIFYDTPLADVSKSAGLTSIFESEKGNLNPAYLGMIKTHSISISFWRDYLLSGYSNYISYSHVISQGNGLGVSYYGYTSGNEKLYYFDGSYDDVVLEKDYEISISYGLNLKGLTKDMFAGIKAKYISSTLAEKYSSKTYSFDLSLANLIYKDIYLELLFKNMGGRLKYIDETTKIPSSIKTTLTKIIYTQNIISAFSAGFEKSEESKEYAFGFDAYIKSISLNIGCGLIKEEDKTKITLGFGFFVSNALITLSSEFPKVFDKNPLKLSLTFFFNDIEDFSFENRKSFEEKKREKRTEKKKEVEPKRTTEKINVIVF